MDLDDFRMILANSRADLWEFIDAAITVASSDFRHELKDRRDRIVERLYSTSVSRCRNCDGDGQRTDSVQMNKFSVEEENRHERLKKGSPSTPQSIHRDDDDEEEERDPYGGLFDDEEEEEDEETKILRIKQRLEDPDQPEDSVVDLLQSLADMDITFKALHDTDIGRHVNRLRKHPSNEVRRLVKQNVSKWKDLVDEWVKLKEANELASSSLLLVDGDSPLQSLPSRNTQNGHHQVPDFGYSPNPHNGSPGSDKNYSEPEPKPKPKAIPRRDAPAVPPQTQSIRKAASAPSPMRRKEASIDQEKLASATKRLQENYQEAQNAKKQRTIQVMDIHEIPKPKNTFFAKNKGGFQGKHR